MKTPQIHWKRVSLYLHLQSFLVFADKGKRHSVVRVPAGVAVEGVRIGVHTDIDPLVGLEVPRLVDVLVFPVSSPPVTTSAVSVTAFRVGVGHHVSAVDS